MHPKLRKTAINIFKIVRKLIIRRSADKEPHGKSWSREIRYNLAIRMSPRLRKCLSPNILIQKSLAVLTQADAPTVTRNGTIIESTPSDERIL